jgi:hypothetical protein
LESRTYREIFAQLASLYKQRFSKFVLKYRECIKQKKNTQQATGYVAEIAREQTSNLFDHFIKWISYKQ